MIFNFLLIQRTVVTIIG